MMERKIYDMELIAETVNFCDRQYKFLLIAPNIERRSRNFYCKFKNMKIFENVIVVDYDNFHKNIDSMQEKTFYDDFADSSVIMIKAVDNNDAIRQLCKLDIKPNDDFAFDITGFSIPNIYQLMNVFKNVIQVSHLDIFYTEPRFYVYEEGYFDAYHKNVEERVCAPVIGYCNVGENEEEILIIFLGFDGGLANLVYFKLGEEGKEIKQTLVVNGFPSYTTKLKDVSLYNNEDLINKIERENIFCASADNPFETYNLLCSLLEKSDGILLNLCTIGSKPMALGACLFALEHQDDVKVTYPFYEKTIFDIDEEAGKIWRYGVSFG